MQSSALLQQDKNRLFINLRFHNVGNTDLISNVFCRHWGSILQKRAWRVAIFSCVETQAIVKDFLLLQIDFARADWIFERMCLRDKLKNLINDYF